MTREIILSAHSRHGIGYWRELWHARELLGFLAWRNVLVLYKQAVLGLAWTVMRPLLTAVAFTFIFGKIARLSSGDIPYLLLVFSGMVPWLFFSTAINECGNSLVANASLITKVYFPRLVVPVSSVLSNLVDLLITTIFLFLLMIWYGVGIGWHLIFLPLVLFVLIIMTIGVGLWVSALNAMYRDTSIIIPFLVTFGLYLSPIGFSSAAIPEQWKILYGINPIVGIVDGFRFSMFGERYPFQVWTFALSFITSIFFVLTGIIYFRTVEKQIIDTL